MLNNGFIRLTATCCAFVALGASALSASCTLTAPALRRGWAAARAPHRAPDQLVGDTVQLLAAALLTAALVWLVLCSVVCVRDLGRQGGGTAAPPPPGLLRPRFLRALVVLAVSSAVVSPPAGAHPGRGPDLPRRLDGLPLPDRVYGVVRTHEVRAGESLWSITADLVRDRPRAGPAGQTVVARTWPRLYRLNRHRIGPDPGLIRPGTILRLPARTATTQHPHPGATR